MWVEPDYAIAGGESLVRQFLYGRAFFQGEFGGDERRFSCRAAVSAALPQILRGMGIRLLVGDGSSGFPHEAFLWEGIDGTRLPVRSQWSPPSPRERSMGRENSGGEIDPGLHCAGPAQKRESERRDPVARGGVFRRGGGAGAVTRSIRAWWRITARPTMSPHARRRRRPATWSARGSFCLLNQGEDSAAAACSSDYAAIFQLARGVAEPARRALAAHIDTSGAAQPALVFNASPFARSEVVSLPDGSPIHVTAPACGYAVVDADAQRPVASFAHPVEVLERQRLVALDNGMLRLIIDRASGNIRSIRDHRHHREVMAAGACGE